MRFLAQPKFVESERQVFAIGGSKAITLPRQWFKFMEWTKGVEMSKVASVMNHFIIIAPPDEKEAARQFFNFFYSLTPVERRKLIQVYEKKKRRK